MISKENLTQDIIKELLDYNPETGSLLWKSRSEKWFNQGIRNKPFSTMKRWNTKYAGTEALSTLNPQGRLYGSIFKTKFLKHRVIWFYMTGKWPEEVDHDDGDPLNNKWINLKDGNHSQNMRNVKLRKDNKSGFCGVSKFENKWRVTVNGEHLGLFNDFNEACKIREQKNIEYGYSERHGT